MTCRTAIALAALLAGAAAAVAGTGESYAATQSGFPQFRRSIETLFSGTPRKRRTGRKSARTKQAKPAPPRIDPVPWPQPRPADARPAIPAVAVPLPPERPIQQAKADPAPPEKLKPGTHPAEQAPPPSPPAAAETPASPPPATAPTGPSACQLRMTADVAVIHPLPPITGPGQCGAEDVVRLDAVVLKDGKRVTLTPAAILRCPMAEAVAHWMRDDVVATVSELGGVPRVLVTAASYDCRGRNRVIGAKLSEHGHANAVDLRGLTLTNGTAVDFTDKAVAKDFREHIRHSACARFATVLGPGSDGYHESHIHLDLIERRGGYRMCQWDVLTVPDVASIPMPPERPKAPDGKN